MEFPGNWGLVRGPSGEGVFWSYQEPFTLHLEAWSAGIGELLGGELDYDTNGGRFVNVLPGGEVLYFDSEGGEIIELAVCPDADCVNGPDLVTFDLEPPEEGVDVRVAFSLLASDESPTFVVMSQNDMNVWHRFIDCFGPTCSTWEVGPWIPLSDWIEGDPAWVNAILQDDLPVMMITDYTATPDSDTTQLVVISCETETCEHAEVAHTGESTAFGHDAVTGADGPIIVYFPSDAPSELRLLACSTPSCTN